MRRKALSDKQFDQDMALILFMMDMLQNIALLDTILQGPGFDWIVSCNVLDTFDLSDSEYNVPRNTITLSNISPLNS